MDAIRTTSETDDGAEAASSVSTDMFSRRGSRRKIINTKGQLKKFMTDHLSLPLESLALDWSANFSFMNSLAWLVRSQHYLLEITIYRANPRLSFIQF